MADGSVSIGSTGPAGPTGLTGAQGIDGLDGATGPMGPQGLAGNDGINGIDGLDGATGPMGPQGPAGADGATGATGSVGSVTAISGTSNANGAFISGGDLTLTPADASNGGVVTTDAQTFAGSKTFTTDINVNGITVGQGGEIGTNNTATGYQALIQNNNGGLNNTANGYQSLYSNNNGGSNNTANGYQSLFSNNNGGSNNTANGYQSLFSNNNGGNNNTAYGYQSLFSNQNGGSNNTAIGHQADVAFGNLTNATAIGSSALVDANNKIQLGNTDVTLVNTSAIYQGSGFKTPTGTATEYLMAEGSVSAGAGVTTAGSGINVTGVGTAASPYVVSTQPPNVVVLSGPTSLDDYDVTGVTAILFDGFGNIFNSTVGAVEGQIIQIKVLYGDLTITDYAFTGTQIFWYNSDGAGNLGNYNLGIGGGCTIMYTEAFSGTGKWYIID